MARSGRKKGTRNAEITPLQYKIIHGKLEGKNGRQIAIEIGQGLTAKLVSGHFCRPIVRAEYDRIAAKRAEVVAQIASPTGLSIAEQISAIQDKSLKTLIGQLDSPSQKDKREAAMALLALGGNTKNVVKGEDAIPVPTEVWELLVETMKEIGAEVEDLDESDAGETEASVPHRPVLPGEEHPGVRPPSASATPATGGVLREPVEAETADRQPGDIQDDGSDDKPRDIRGSEEPQHTYFDSPEHTDQRDEEPRSDTEPAGLDASAASSFPGGHTGEPESRGVEVE